MLKDDREKVGILIPTCNRLQYLQNALQSALAQTHPDLSVLVIDDDSSDGTPDYLREIRDSRVSYVFNERNLGLADNINRGVHLFPGNIAWCTILGDDDVMDENFIRAMLEAVRFYSPKSIVHGHRIIIDKHGEYIRHTKLSPPEESAFAYMIYRLLKKRETFLTGVFFRKDMFVKVGGYPSFRTGVMADDAFIFALALQDRLVYTKEAIAKQRFHSEAESLSFRDICIILETTKQFSGYCEEMARYYGIPNFIPPTLFKEILNKYTVRINSECWLQCYHNTTDSLWPTIGESTMPDIPMKYPEQFSRRIRLDAQSLRMFNLYPEKYIAYRAVWFFIDSIKEWYWGNKIQPHINSKAAPDS